MLSKKHLPVIQFQEQNTCSTRSRRLGSAPHLTEFVSPITAGNACNSEFLLLLMSSNLASHGVVVIAGPRGRDRRPYPYKWVRRRFDLVVYAPLRRRFSSLTSASCLPVRALASLPRRFCRCRARLLHGGAKLVAPCPPGSSGPSAGFRGGSAQRTRCCHAP
jgi:hypothetical protein